MNGLLAKGIVFVHVLLFSGEAGLLAFGLEHSGERVKLLVPPAYVALSILVGGAGVGMALVCMIWLFFQVLKGRQT